MSARSSYLQLAKALLPFAPLVQNSAGSAPWIGVLKKAHEMERALEKLNGLMKMSVVGLCPCFSGRLADNCRTANSF
jgi:hypothetical protein